MGSESRRQERVKGYAKVLLPPSMVPGYLRDLSRTGCQVSFLQNVPAAPGDVIALTIVPGTEAATPGVTVSLRVSWARSDGLYFSLGGELESLATEEDQALFDAIVAYYQGYQ